MKEVFKEVNKGKEVFIIRLKDLENTSIKFSALIHTFGDKMMSLRLYLLYPI